MWGAPYRNDDILFVGASTTYLVTLTLFISPPLPTTLPSVPGTPTPLFLEACLLYQCPEAPNCSVIWTSESVYSSLEVSGNFSGRYLTLSTVYLGERTCGFGMASQREVNTLEAQPRPLFTPCLCVEGALSIPTLAHSRAQVGPLAHVGITASSLHLPLGEGIVYKSWSAGVLAFPNISSL